MLKSSSVPVRKPSRRSPGRRPPSPRVTTDGVQQGNESLMVVVEALPVGILMVDGTGSIVLVNATAESILGYSRAELIGRPVEILLPERLRVRHVNDRGGYLMNPAQRRMGAGRDLFAVRKDGREIPVEIGLSPAQTPQGGFVLASIIDISERKAAEATRDRLIKAVSETAHNVAAVAAELLAGTTQQAAGAQQQAAAVTETVATIDQVAQTADQAAQRARLVADASLRTVEVSRAGRRAVEEAVGVMGTVKDQVETVAENILVLAEQAQQIGEIIATVNEIAEQTNLLALNAAIEAARAGEHGKGFSVVATEVKALAEQSKKATAQVRQILGNIQKATNSAVMAAENETRSVSGAIKVVNQSGETIRTLSDTINDAAQAAAQISASAGQQATGMAQIHQAMRNISHVTTQNVASVRQAERAAQDLNALGNTLKDLVAGYGV